ncbi:hypothetical protein AB9F35_32875, partial [Rhizobium leguminosarum]
ATKPSHKNNTQKPASCGLFAFQKWADSRLFERPDRFGARNIRPIVVLNLRVVTMVDLAQERQLVEPVTTARCRGRMSP